MNNEVTFYAGEDLEMQSGRFKRGLTNLKEAIDFYKNIEHPKGVKGIGITMEDGLDWDLVQGNCLMISDLNLVPHLKERGEIEEAIRLIHAHIPDIEER